MARLIFTTEIGTLGHRLPNLQWGLLISGSSHYFPSKVRQLLDFVLTVVLTVTLSINTTQTSIVLRNVSICHTWEFISRAAVTIVVKYWGKQSAASAYQCQQSKGRES